MATAPNIEGTRNPQSVASGDFGPSEVVGDLHVSGALTVDGAVTGTGAQTATGGLTLGADLVFANGLHFTAVTTAITANSTTTSLPKGSLALTTNATGAGVLFISDGTKWQLA